MDQNNFFYQSPSLNFWRIPLMNPWLDWKTVEWYRESYPNKIYTFLLCFVNKERRYSWAYKLYYPVNRNKTSLFYLQHPNQEFSVLCTLSSITIFNCGFICEHLLFIQYKKVCWFYYIFCDLKFFPKIKLLNTNFWNFDHS